MASFNQCNIFEEVFKPMGKPKKQSSPRKTGLRRSHLVVQLARVVNAKSPVKAYTTRRESAKKTAVVVKLTPDGKAKSPVSPPEEGEKAAKAA